ncbi:17001_t:CDS:2, partial [Dentiscutata erythropus]
GEAGSVPLEDVLNFCIELQDVLQNYEPKDIFNCDETALFWRQHVIASTIIHSWDRAGILSPRENFDDNLTLMSEKTEEQSAQKYIEIDSYVNIEENLTVDNIVNLVNGQDECESEKEQNEVVVKISNTIVELDNLLKYIQQNELEITLSLMKDLCNFKRYIAYLCNENRRQSTLEEFINLIV